MPPPTFKSNPNFTNISKATAAFEIYGGKIFSTEPFFAPDGEVRQLCDGNKVVITETPRLQVDIKTANSGSLLCYSSKAAST